MRRRVRALRRGAVLAAGLALGCVGEGGRAHPLYAGARQPLDQVALLSGDVEFVDGKRVIPHGQEFELSPGCHIVRTPTKWGRSDFQAGSGAVILSGPGVDFAMPMEAGRRYTVLIEVSMRGTMAGDVKITATEADEHGTPLRTFPHATPEALAACRSDSL